MLEHTETVLLKAIGYSDSDICQSVDFIHDPNAASKFVPRRHKNYYKFWWDEEMDSLKSASIESNQIWKAAGKPRHGPIFEKRQHCRLQYRSRIREHEKLTVT